MNVAAKTSGKQFSLIEESPTDAAEELRSLHTPELVIALCGPIGSPLHEVATTTEDMLTSKFGYTKVEIIRLSSFIAAYASKHHTPIAESGVERFKALIKLGNNMRDTHGKEILAKLAISRIATTRAALAEEQTSAAEEGTVSQLKAATRPIRVAHIIDSIKNQSELEILRLVYGELLYTLGVYAPISSREATLKKQMSDVDVSALMDRDSGEEKENGQTVRQTFPFSDYVLRIESRTTSEIEERVERFLTLVLASKPLTPSVHEMAMYAAASAAAHSACLSRQVGAAVTTADGTLIASGWNDVPRYGGGLYISADDTNLDLRCWNRDGGKCVNDEEKDGLAERVSKILLEEGLVDTSKVESVTKHLRQSTGLKDLIEFSRAIHAEMHAILRALPLGGEQIKGRRHQRRLLHRTLSKIARCQIA